MRIFIMMNVLITFMLSADFIGTIKNIRNDVFVVRNFETLDSSKGFKLMSKDIIVTGDKSKAKLVFKDNTRITVGKNSIFEIEDYLFDKTKNSRAKFKAKSGFFQAVTGKIGKISRDSFKLKTKTATIGVRGTVFEGQIGRKGESVKCVKGTIAISAKGKTFILNEGETLEITKKMFEADIKILGEIVEITGTVFLINGKNTFLATKGYQIGVKDKIVTSYSSTATIHLVNQTDINLLNNSACLLDFKYGEQYIQNLKGLVKVKSKSESKTLKRGEIYKGSE